LIMTLPRRQRRNGIDDGAMGAVTDDHHRAPGQIRIAFDNAAIVQIAVEHRGFAGIEMLAHGGVDAVGADQQIALRFADGRPADR
jgi:hypothetical protein